MYSVVRVFVKFNSIWFICSIGSKIKAMVVRQIKEIAALKTC